MEPIDDDTTMGELMGMAQELAEQAIPAIEVTFELAEASKFGVFVVLQMGGFDGYDWSEHVHQEKYDPLELDEGEMAAYQMAEAVMLMQLVAIRRGLQAAGTPMPEAPVALIAATGRNR